MGDFGSGLADFFATPFKGVDMDAADWFLLLGLVMISWIIWAYILNHIKEAAT